MSVIGVVSVNSLETIEGGFSLGLGFGSGMIVIIGVVTGVSISTISIVGITVVF